MKIVTQAPRPARELVREYQRQRVTQNPRLLQFDGVDGLDVYNPSAPFRLGSKHYLAGRVEGRDTEWTTVRLFEKVGPEHYALAHPELRFANFQDPFVTRIKGRLILGGVQVTEDPRQPGRIVHWHTLFYTGSFPAKPRLLAMGPSHMKDIRLAELADGRVAVFTRPQGKKGGKGKIGLMVLPSLKELSGEDMLDATIYDSHFVPGEWGGVNEVHLLKNGLLGIIGHIAYSNRAGRHYMAMAYVHDLESGQHSPLKVIATRADFPEGPAKRPDLADVIFTAGLVRRRKGLATLYAGLSDCQCGCVDIPDPFLEFEG